MMLANTTITHDLDSNNIGDLACLHRLLADKASFKVRDTVPITCSKKGKWCRMGDSNTRPHHYE